MSMEVNSVVLLQLLLAHVLTDFVLQSNKMVEHKRKYKAKSWYLYVHSALAGILTYLILQQWSAVLIPVLIGISHFFIDLWKLHQKKDNLIYFIVDQVLHLLVIAIAWIYLTQNWEWALTSIKSLAFSEKFLVILIGYVVAIFPTGFLIGKATEKWQREIAKETEQESLKKAGRYIGIVERVLVLTFILSSNFSAIGFLIGAKSILRFGDVKGARKHTEYVLIGTLMSFAICILLGLLIRYFIFK